MVRTEDRHLIRQCLLGDADAFGELVEKYIDSMHALAHRRVSNFHDAQDLTQEAFLIAYQRLSTLKRWDNFPEWLYSIIKNLCNKWWQSQLRQPDREFVEEIDTEILNQPSIGLHRKIKMHSSLYEALTTLPEMYHQVLSLYYLSGMKSREIGEYLGISKNTVDTRIRRAKNRLREEMQQSISFEEREASSRGRWFLSGGRLRFLSKGSRNRGIVNAVPLFFFADITILTAIKLSIQYIKDIIYPKTSTTSADATLLNPPAA